MTVCIAARAGRSLVGATDRMVTSGDVEFEPSAGTKIQLISTAIAMMTAGDAALQVEILRGVISETQPRIVAEPENWWTVSEVAELYAKHYNAIRRRRAENAVLLPVGLTESEFISRQNAMADSFIRDLAQELMNFELPTVGVLVVGHDWSGPHIYRVLDGEITVHDSIGFASIGSGARHANSQFMFARPPCLERGFYRHSNVDVRS